MGISIDDVNYVAKLARLRFSEEELQATAQKFGAILNYMGQLNEIDTAGVAPTTHVLQLENVFREDLLSPCLSRGEALSNAPVNEDGYFKVPKIL